MCVHHWLLNYREDNQLMGRCVKCGGERNYTEKLRRAKIQDYGTQPISIGLTDLQETILHNREVKIA